MRIGLFGGTFNPIHLGHIKAAGEVKKGFALDRIVFIPVSRPPHKQKGRLAEADDRMAMIRLAVSGKDDFSISGIEQKREGASYTIDTVRHYQATAPEGVRFYLIVGLDAFLELDTWKAYRDLLRCISFIVMARPVPVRDDLCSMQKVVGAYLANRISDAYRFDPSRAGWFHPENRPVFIFDFQPLDISSTAIRKRIAEGRPIVGFVPEDVAVYIQEKGLYR